jgi:hypothetical protein
MHHGAIPSILTDTESTTRNALRNCVMDVVAIGAA